MKQQPDHLFDSSSLHSVFFALAFGIIAFFYLVKVDNSANLRSREQVINLLLSTAPKLIRDGEFIKLHALVNTRTDFGICITDNLNRFLVSNSEEKCDRASSESRELFYESKVYGNLFVSNNFDFEGRLPFYLIFLFSWAAVLTTLLYLRNRHQSNLSLEYLNDLLDTGQVGDEAVPSWFSKKFQRLYITVVSFKEQATRRNEFEIEKAKSQAMFEIAAQVSHDIRSPVMALDMISSKLEVVSETDRLVIRNSIDRIKSIANTLLATNRTAADHRFEDGDSSVNAFLIANEIEQVLIEFRALGGTNASAHINFNQSVETLHAFTNVDATAFQRALSNIIANGLEALCGRPGKVILTLSESNAGTLNLSIKDNGIGISKDHIKMVGTKGFTVGKQEGNGLGVHSAVTTVKEWGGSLTVKSEEGLGTEVSITIPRVEPPYWFANEINLPLEGYVLVVDDDCYIHNLWKERFASVEKIHTGLICKYLGSAEELLLFMKHEYLDSVSTLFLIDQDLAGVEKGFDLITRLGIAAESVLVTNRFADPALQNASIKIKLRILPKPLIVSIAVAFSAAIPAADTTDIEKRTLL